jgi:hypothetical protein
MRTKQTAIRYGYTRNKERGNPTSDGRILVALAATLVLVGCTIWPYEYVELTSDNVEVTEVGRPPNRAVTGGRRDIPVRYALEDLGVSLSLALTQSSGPAFKIESSVPIAAVSIEPGYVFRESPFEYTIIWTHRLIDNYSSPVGKPVQIRIDLEGRPDPILISGVVAESGRTYSGIGI